MRGANFKTFRSRPGRLIVGARFGPKHKNRRHRGVVSNRLKQLSSAGLQIGLVLGHIVVDCRIFSAPYSPIYGMLHQTHMITTAVDAMGSPDGQVSRTRFFDVAL